MFKSSGNNLASSNLPVGEADVNSAYKPGLTLGSHSSKQPEVTGLFPLELLPWQPIIWHHIYSHFFSLGCFKWVAEVVYPNYKNSCL